MRGVRSTFVLSALTSLLVTTEFVQSKPGKSKGYYVVNAHNVGIFQAFCGSGSSTNAAGAVLYCFHAEPHPFNYVYRNDSSISNIIVVPNIEADKTHIWSVPTTSFERTDEHLFEIVALDYRTAITMLRDRENSDTDMASAAAGETGITKKKIYPSFHQSQTVPTTRTRGGTSSINWELCINSQSHVCRVNNMFKNHAKLIFNNKVDNILGTSAVTNLYAYRLNKTKEDGILEDFGIIEPTFILQLAENYLNDKMTIYTKAVHIMIEDQVWRRECILVNEVKHLFKDFSYYYVETYQGIQMLVIFIMNGFYNLATLLTATLKKLCELLVNSPYEEKWSHISRWQLLYHSFKTYLKTPLQNMMNAEKYVELQESIDRYITAFNNMEKSIHTKDTYAISKIAFEQERQKMNQTLFNEADQLTSINGIRSTVGWFASKAEFFKGNTVASG